MLMAAHSFIRRNRLNGIGADGFSSPAIIINDINPQIQRVDNKAHLLALLIVFL